MQQVWGNVRSQEPEFGHDSTASTAAVAAVVDSRGAAGCRNAAESE